MDELEELLDAFEKAVIEYAQFLEDVTKKDLRELEKKVSETRQAIIDFYNEV